MVKAGFIGGGAMAEAMVKGLLAKDVLERDAIYVSDHKSGRCQELKEKYGIHAEVGADNFVGLLDYVFMAVKPNAMEQAAAEIRELLGAETVVISLAAGYNLAKLADLFPHNPVVRVMPNTPLAVGEGMSALAFDAKISAADKETVLGFFEAAGKAVVVSEALFDAVTGLSGSGPAFVFLMIDAMSDAGVLAGLKRSDAKMLAAQTVLGAAKMVLESGLHPMELRDQVTSPAGTTIEGVRVMEEKGVRGALIDTVMAAVKKSQEMGKTK